MFKLEHRSKAQNVASSMTNVSVYCSFEKSIKLRNGSYFENF